MRGTWRDALRGGDGGGHTPKETWASVARKEKVARANDERRTSSSSKTMSFATSGRTCSSSTSRRSIPVACAHPLSLHARRSNRFATPFSSRLRRICASVRFGVSAGDNIVDTDSTPTPMERDPELSGTEGVLEESEREW